MRLIILCEFGTQAEGGGGGGGEGGIEVGIVDGAGSPEAALLKGLKLLFLTAQIKSGKATTKAKVRPKISSLLVSSGRERKLLEILTLGLSVFPMLYIKV